MDNNFRLIKVMKAYGFDNGRAYKPGDLLFFHPDYGSCYSDGQPFLGKISVSFYDKSSDEWYSKKISIPEKVIEAQKHARIPEKITCKRVLYNEEERQGLKLYPGDFEGHSLYYGNCICRLHMNDHGIIENVTYWFRKGDSWKQYATTMEHIEFIDALNFDDAVWQQHLYFEGLKFRIVKLHSKADLVDGFIIDANTVEMYSPHYGTGYIRAYDIGMDSAKLWFKKEHKWISQNVSHKANINRYDDIALAETLEDIKAYIKKAHDLAPKLEYVRHFQKAAKIQGKLINAGSTEYKHVEYGRVFTTHDSNLNCIQVMCLKDNVWTSINV